MKAAVVTGCAGFIGSRLCQRLLADGWLVLGIDCLVDSRPDQVEAIRMLDWNEAFSFCKADLVSDLDSAIRFCDGTPIDSVFHLAAIPGIFASVENPSRTYDNNVASTASALSVASECKARRFVFASSSSVYGNGAEGGVACVECKTPCSPLNAYAASKVECERIVKDISESKGIESTILRPFSVYGPGMRPDLAMSKIADSIQFGTEFKMRGDGSSERDYTYIDDVVDAFVLAAQAPQFMEKYRTFNICGGNPVSLKTVISSLESALGGKATIMRSNAEKYDAARTSGDYSEAKKHIGWEPKIGFADGINLFARWRKTQKSANGV